ncbi:MAG TPA: S46 family peptidase [Planctomycetia bacterium]|nr:S46 family peptidase [Planctomycetia bacterium]
MRATMRAILAGAAATTVAGAARADEGMWLYNNIPTKVLKEKYGFEPTKEWLDNLRMSSVRFNSGGSGSFVSSSGLIMTNHHVGADTLQKISTKEKDYIKTGFFAKSKEDEIKATDLELNVLMEITDVTAEVTGAVKEGASPAEAQKARRAAINDIEKKSQEATKLKSEVVTLYQGGAYHLYRFKKYTDVRLVFAPEKDIAFFGGDPDNFEFPRYDLDVCFFRAYENGQPAKPPAHLKWNPEGCKEGEVTFVSGHPGRTNRLNTVRHLEYIRDKLAPAQLDMLRRWEINIKIYADRSLENLRRAQDDLFGVQNSRKARLGGLGGLQDPAFFGAKVAAEKELREKVNADEKLKAQFGGAWDEVAAAVGEAEKIAKPYGLLESGRAFHSDLFGIARKLVRLNDEKVKPNGERLREYGDAGMETLKEQLFADSPIYPDFEIAKLADSLSMLIEQLGANDPLVLKIMAGKSPPARAAELVNGTKLASVAERKAAAEAGAEKLAASSDPMIQLAKLVDGPARELRTAYETKVDEPTKQAYGKIAKARFALYGDSVYPDATFTLRLAFGEVKGFTESDGTRVPAMTTIGGTFDHAYKHGDVPPFQLPKSWVERKSKLNPTTPFNFISTADIIGGNSGSPVVNKAGEVVGLIFDGNIQSLVLDYAFSDVQARAVSVHTAAITESLRKIYDADSLADELGK